MGELTIERTNRIVQIVQDIVCPGEYMWDRVMRTLIHYQLNCLSTVSPVIPHECMSFWYGVDILIEKYNGGVIGILRQSFIAHKTLSACFEYWCDKPVDYVQAGDFARC